MSKRDGIAKVLPPCAVTTLEICHSWFIKQTSCVYNDRMWCDMSDEINGLSIDVLLTQYCVGLKKFYRQRFYTSRRSLLLMCT